jgi:hypothetical protein
MKDSSKIIIPAVILIILYLSVPASVSGQEKGRLKLADRPLYHDPVYDGSTDPVIIWNKKEREWFMLYTGRRANIPGLNGIEAVHGSRITIAESSDGGATWKYRDTCDVNYRTSGYTHWAPEVIEYKGLYHMYLTHVPGIFRDWNHPRSIIHLTSRDLIKWDFQSELNLSSGRCIDACVFRLPDGTWRMYYNNEADKKSIYYADSPDLYRWTDSGKKVIGDQQGEGPNVFYWKGKAWMIVDNWNGLGVYYSNDFVNWNRQEKSILDKPGTGPEDQEVGHHADVIISRGRAYIFYFTHIVRSRSIAIHVAELGYVNGQIICDRDKPVYINLKPARGGFDYY